MLVAFDWNGVIDGDAAASGEGTSCGVAGAASIRRGSGRRFLVLRGRDRRPGGEDERGAECGAAGKVCGCCAWSGLSMRTIGPTQASMRRCYVVVIGVTEFSPPIA